MKKEKCKIKVGSIIALAAYVVLLAGTVIIFAFWKHIF